MAQVVLDDPVLDARHPFTRVFLLAEYWKKKYLQLKDERKFMRVHELKTWPGYYEDIITGRLPFSVRSNEGRGFQKGDIVKLQEWDPNAPEVSGTSKYTGRSVELEITYVESSWGVSPGHVVLGFGMHSDMNRKELT